MAAVRSGSIIKEGRWIDGRSNRVRVGTSKQILSFLVQGSSDWTLLWKMVICQILRDRDETGEIHRESDSTR